MVILTMSKNVNIKVLLQRVIGASIFVLALWILYSKFVSDEGDIADRADLLHNPSIAKTTPYPPKKVNVTVFYEVLCPDSRHFILRQLFPTWQKVSELMEIDYRPFGKATYKKLPGGGYKFQCQHGPIECQVNIVHNCVVKYVPKPMPYIKCMMEDAYKPLEIGQKCAYRLDIDWEPIRKCAEGREGEELMAVVAQESLGVKHKLSFIPTVALNGEYSNQNNILKNFLPVLCNQYQVDNSNTEQKDVSYSQHCVPHSNLHM